GYETLRGKTSPEVGQVLLPCLSPCSPPSDVGAAASSALGSQTSAGSRMVKVEPWPAALSTVMSPPIIWQNSLLIARPSPLPPYWLAVALSACENAWNSLAICSGVMPIPVSVTLNVIQSTPSSA